MQQVFLIMTRNVKNGPCEEHQMHSFYIYNRCEVYPRLQKYSYLKEWSFNTLPTQGISLVSHHLFSTALKQQWHQQLPSSSFWVTQKFGSVQKSWQTNRCYNQPLPSPGPSSPWLTGSSRWCHFPVHVWKTRVTKSKHHSAFTESKLLQLLLTPLH